MCEILRLERLVERTPWGFRLTGGYDFGTPLSVVKVTGGSIAALSGVKVGDIVLEINGQSTKHFIHTDAQNFIGISGNHLTLTVMRGSLVTPPDVTPSRGRTPAYENEGEEMNGEQINGHLNYRLESTAVENDEDGNEYDGLQDEPVVHVNIGMKPEITHGIQTRHPGEILDPNVTDTELDELLTGNEEVLDEGLLGINFKKFFPQVDFIRESEVFKFLQNENTMKEIPEEVQLQKEPTKRFSTFLQKPKPPPPKPTGPLWHYPKAPRYLPRESEKVPEQPRRRPKRESCHTVLWLFLEESGEHVVDERWGNQEEERINLSRCEMHEEDTVSLTSSVTTAQSGRDSRLDKVEDIVPTVKGMDRSDVGLKDSEAHVEKLEGKLCTSLDRVEEQNEIKMDDAESKLEVKAKAEISEDQSCKVFSMDTTEDNETNSQQQDETFRKQTEKKVFSDQLADIQAQIAALEVQAPSDLQTQLLAIQEQLSKIVTVKNVHVTSSHGSKASEQMDKREFYKDERTKVEEDEKCLEEVSEDYYEYTFECEAKINGEKGSSDEKQSLEERSGCRSESGSNKDDCESIKDDSEDNNFLEVNNECIRGFQKGEYELCEAPISPAPKTKKIPAHPITPQMRPIVLPGGRMWRQPKDACHDDFYQGVLVAQAEVMIGNTGGVNFTKYVPPKFDVSQSAVCKLVHEIEDKTRALKDEKENEYYQTPINKRHFYAATLREPDPIGGIDL